ncbi:MAG: SIR2 family protein [Thermoguttaceae bacterium]|nr:SIR2 family protein [Thermoguttaceae bacterium]MBQ9799174.1 SIR2 family protein [Thermoguttaceae bacterium]
MSDISHLSSENEPNEQTQDNSLNASKADEETSAKDNKTQVYNFLKVRDDERALKLARSSDDAGLKKITFPEAKPSWAASGVVSVDDLRARIEPWLGALLQAEHLSLLVGSGLSTALQLDVGAQSNNGMEEVTSNTKYAKQIYRKAKESVKASGRVLCGKSDGDTAEKKVENDATVGKDTDSLSSINLEDYFRVANELLRGLEVLDNEEEREDVWKLRKEIEEKIQNFANNILSIENQIATADEEKREKAFQKLTRFLVPFASRSGVRERLNLFTTNYDRVLEAGADVAGLRLVDRFVGALSPIFRSSRLDVDMHYNPPGIRGEPRYLEGVVRYAKLHGSIDWISANDEIRRIGLPFGATTVEPYLQAPGLNADASKIMIYPNAAKDRETAEYPYVELFRDFAAAICRPNSVLVTYGYSFGDEHINRVIRDMLTIPSTHLLAIAYDDNTGRIRKAFEDWGRQNQISLMLGPDLASLDALVDHFLPRPALDETLCRMTQNLERRYGKSGQSGNKEGDQ